MKKWIIIVASIILVVVIAAAAVIWFAGPNFRRDRVEDPDCPYAYQIRRGIGRLVVTVKGTEDGFRWEGDTESYGVASVARRVSRSGRTTFTLKPLMNGQDSLRIILRDETRYGNITFSIHVDFSVEEGAITAISCGHQKLDGAIRDEGGRYSILPQADGTYRVAIAAVPDAIWQGVCETGGAFVTREELAEDTAGDTEWFILQPNGTEESVIRFTAYGRDERIEIHIGLVEGGYSILSHSFLTGDK